MGEPRRGRGHTPNAVGSVHTTEVKISPYRPTQSSVNKMFIIWQTKKNRLK